MSPRLALLIDAENISYKDLPRILRRVTPLGEIVLRAVYGDWDQPTLKNWHEVAEKNDFKIRNQSNPSKTKNTSDMRLIMDAMEIIHHVPVDAFCLVTNDADYIPLCDKLHESKKYVIGIGYQHAAELLMRACDQFIFIKRKTLPVTPVAPVVENPIPIKVEPPPPVLEKPKSVQPAPAKPQTLPDIRKLISEAFAKASTDADDWVHLGALGNAIRQIQKGITSKSYGHATLTKLMQSMPDFIELQDSGGSKSARLKKKVIQKPKKLPTLNAIVLEAFATAQPEKDNWVSLSELGTALRKVQKGFTSKNYGHTTLSKLLQTMTDFVELKGKGSSASTRLKKKSAPKQATHNDPQLLIVQAFDTIQPEKDDWVTLSAIGTAIRQVQPDFQLKTYGHATLSKFLQTMPDLVELHENGNGKSARLKKKSTSKQKTPVKSQEKATSTNTQPAKHTKKPTPDLMQKSLQDLISAAFIRAPKDVNKWVSLLALESAIQQIQVDFTADQYGYTTLAKLLENMPHLVELKNNGNGKSARLKK